ncbi:hypothetical protein [Paucisalibacillus globulus]|uniref:hypothetical protein n=1 Tax=Paucisalibacillus globulus TaxID=351095 RepID=UPI000BB951EF|nr:hypothetical protein [Paucisalibacillus globulus]
MGFYYFIILFIGIFVTVGASIQAFKAGTLFKKKVIFLGIVGILLIGSSFFYLHQVVLKLSQTY